MELDAQQRDKLTVFADAVAASPHNLVSKRARTELLSRHVPESVEFATRLPPGPARVLDIGSGGGFPGMVVAIVRPDLAVELLDSTRKKTRFLEEMVAELGLDVPVHTGRAEELASTELAGSFDVVTVRAVASLAQLVPWCAPFLSRGGQIHALKGDRWSEELEAAQSAIVDAELTVASTPDGIGEDNAETGLRVVMLQRPA